MYTRPVSEKDSESACLPKCETYLVAHQEQKMSVKQLGVKSLIFCFSDIRWQWQHTKYWKVNQIYVGSRGHTHNSNHNNYNNNNNNNNKNSNNGNRWRSLWWWFPATELPSTVILLETGTHCAVQAETNTSGQDNTHCGTFWTKHTS